MLSRSAIKVPIGKCCECNDGKDKPLANKSKQLCQYHNNLRKFNERGGFAGCKNGRCARPIKKQSSRSSSVLTRCKDEVWYGTAIKKAELIRRCEGCGCKLEGKLVRRNISHILGKQAYPHLRNHPKNYNLMCFTCHDLWEFGTDEVRQQLNCYQKNINIIEQLKQIQQ